MPSRNRLPKILLDGRRRKKLTQAELAHGIGVSSRSIESWETGTHLPHTAALKVLAVELGLDFEMLKIERWNERERRRRARERRTREEDATAGAVA